MPSGTLSQVVGQTAGMGSALKQTFMAIVIAVGGFVSFMTVAAFFGGLWWAFDLFANFRWHMMWIALICAILYALSARGISTIIFLIAVIINAFLIAPLYIGSQPGGTGEDGIKVVTADMYGGVPDRESALRWMFESDADLIIVSGVTTARVEPLIVEGSPYQILASPPENTTGIVVVGMDAYSVTQATTQGSKQTVLAVSVPTDSTTIDVVTAWGHIGSSSEQAELLEERIALLAEVTARQSDRVTVVGNLGATRWSKPMRDFRGELELRDAMEGRGYLATSPVSDFPLIGGFLGMPIDVVLMSEGVTPLSLVTGPDLGANHLPVTVIIGPTS